MTSAGTSARATMKAFLSLVIAVSMTAQTPPKGWAPPRTPDGKPDLQGVWTNVTITPLERPREVADKQFFMAKREGRRRGGDDDGWAGRAVVVRARHSRAKRGPADAAQFLQQQLRDRAGSRL